MQGEKERPSPFRVTWLAEHRGQSVVMPTGEPLGSRGGTLSKQEENLDSTKRVLRTIRRL